MWKCEPNPENDFCEAGGAFLAVDRAAARQIKRRVVEFGSLRDRPECEQEARFHSGEQELLRAPRIARASNSFGGAERNGGTPAADSVA